ncbi:MAG: hypothetical protein ACRC8S_22855 [Fimbriiglobus sp.]|jgi:hypothetical protein
MQVFTPEQMRLQPTPHVQRCSIYSDCVTEADRFKWIESEKAGRDLGEAAIQGWVHQHWSGYLRARWLEHLQGKTFWVELDRGDFGLLQLDFTNHKQLLDDIVQLLKDGHENLDVLLWAMRSKLPLEPVRQILEALDINSRRLAHKFEHLCA